MPWWPNALSPSSSSSPNSQHQQQLQHRRLTRAKKLRHLRQQDLYDLDLLQSNDYLRSPPEVDISASDRFSSAVPHPLPLPDLSALFSHSDKVRKSDAGSVDNFLLPSPNGTSKERERGGGRERSSHVSNDIASARNRRILQVDARGRPDAKSNVDVSQKVDAQRSVQRAETCKGMPQRIKGMDRVRDKFAIEIPFRSAPTSAYSSPVPSPQRLSTGDMFSAFRTEPLGCSAPEMRLKFMSTGFPYAVPQDNLVFSRDNSPLRSPQIKSPMQPRMSTTGSASPRHPKLLIDASTGLHESTCHVKHPLPLPPGATSSTQSSPVPLRGTRPDSLPLRTQWTKGKLIGRGTFGSVYVGTNRETGALCAMKEVDLFPDDPKSIECMKQLEQEIKVFSRLKHPNIVQYYGSQIVEDQFYIYLEYVYPGSINKYVREHCGAVTESVVRNFTRHILYGLAYLHSRKTVHRDIKGANLLVDSSGVVKLADFGMARHLAGQAADLSLKGSPYWMAPELMQAVLQKDNNSDLAFAVDIWSLGCTIIEMLTGKPPWSEYEGAAAMFKVLRESPPIPETLSPEGKDFLRCCFQRNPADRPTANMLLEHRFLRNSQQDKAHSPRELAEYKLDKTPLSPSRWTMKGKLVSNNETGQNSNLGTPDLTVGPRHSPRSTLDTLPNISPPHAVPSPQDLGIPSASRLHNQLPELMSPFSKRWKGRATVPAFLKQDLC